MVLRLLHFPWQLAPWPARGFAQLRFSKLAMPGLLREPVPTTALWLRMQRGVMRHVVRCERRCQPLLAVL